MANDGGLVAILAQWLADTLKVLTYGDDDTLVFKTVDIWKHQVGITESGMEASLRYFPFAFVGAGDEDTAREGDNDLRRIFDFKIIVGVDSKEDGVALWGDANHLGTSKIRDLVIAAFDKKRPDGTNITCDEFYYAGGLELLDQPKRHWIRLTFEVSQMKY
ncbi:MAG: hypothetical protein ABSB91_00250 [Sedimentisphaerales bacterium]|jgi:hypothetical protein